MNKIRLLKFLDRYIVRLVCLLVIKIFGLKNRHISSSLAVSPQDSVTILVIRPGGIGDTVLLFPLLISLKKKYLSTNIYVLAEKRNASVFYANEVVKKVFLYDRFFPIDIFKLLCTKFHIVIDTEQFHYFSALFSFLTNARVRCGFDTNERRYFFTHKVPYSHEIYEVESFLSLYQSITGERSFFNYSSPFFPLDNRYIIWAKRRLASLKGKISIVISPGASIPERRWSIDNYATIINWLLALRTNVILCGGKKEIGLHINIRQKLTEGFFLDLIGKTSIPENAGIISISDLFLSSDTGLLHLAYGLGIPTLSLFGPGIIQKWAPRGGRHLVITKYTSCSPCTKFGYTPPCQNKIICMEGITVDEVKEGILYLLKLSGKSLSPEPCRK